MLVVELAFYLAFTPVFCSHFFIEQQSICPLLDVHLMKWELKCQKPVVCMQVLHDDNREGSRVPSPPAGGASYTPTRVTIL